MTAESSDEKQVTGLEYERCAALVSRDLRRIATILAPDLRYVHSTGTIHTHQQLLEFLETTVNFQAVERSGLQTEVHGELAWMQGNLSLHGTLLADGVTFNSYSYVTQIWRKSQSNWQLVLLQSTQVPRPDSGLSQVR